MSNKRTNIILNYIRQKKDVSLKELHLLFPSYTEMTIRRDLNTLEKNGYIKRYHGGARINSDETAVFYNYSQRSSTAIEYKRHVAVKAISLIEDSSSIFIDAGTTALEMVKLLPDEMHLFITTNDPYILFEASKRKNIEVFLTGGILNKSIFSLSGPAALSAMDRVNFDTAFIGAAGFSAEHGFSNASINECEVKRRAISSAKRTIILLDSDKFGKSLPYTFATPAEIDILVTNKPLPDELSKVAANNFEVIF